MTDLLSPPVAVERARTSVPLRTTDDQPTDRPRPISSRTMDDWLSLGGAAVASLFLDWLLFEQILPTSGIAGFIICWYVCFVGLYAGVTALSQPRPIVIDRIATGAVHGAAALVAVVLISVLSYTFVEGWPAYHHLNFFTHDMDGVRETAPLNQGGILHALVGTLVEVSIAVAISLPLGLITAVYMTEVGGGFSRIVRTVIEAMTALPDLIAGLFVYTVLIVQFGEGRSGLAASLSLAVTMLPIIARSGEVVLRVVPGGLREAGLALGAPRWRTVLSVILPTAFPGLCTAAILGIARGIGETAPVLITSGASTFFNANPLDQKPMNSLPLFVYTGVRSGEPAYITRGFGAASVLLFVVLVLFVFIRLLGRPRAGAR